jgi:hypothetical protein
MPEGPISEASETNHTTGLLGDPDLVVGKEDILDEILGFFLCIESGEIRHPAKARQEDSCDGFCVGRLDKPDVHLPTLPSSVDLCEHPHDLPPSIRMHRHEVDDVGPVLTVLVAVAHQAGGDGIAIGLVAESGRAEVSPLRAVSAAMAPDRTVG